MNDVKNWDAIIIGAGIIGLSLAIELNQQGLRVLVVEKGEPGREASWAAGGMLVDFVLETPPGMRELATESARMYPEFVHELEDESGLKIDLRSVGTLVLSRVETGLRPVSAGQSPATTQAYALPRPLAELEPALRIWNRTELPLTPLFLKERCVDPRHLTAAAIAAARHRGVDFSHGDHVLSVEVADGKASGVRTNKTQFAAGMVVNCAGAWAGQIGPHPFPTRPVKGQMLCVAMPEKERQRADAVRRHAGKRTGAPCGADFGVDTGRLPDPAQRRADADRDDRGRSGLRQADRAGDDPEVAAGCARSGSEISRCTHFGSLGRSASGNTRRAADSRRNADARIFCSDRAFSGWNSAGTGDGESYGTNDDRAKAAD